MKRINLDQMKNMSIDNLIELYRDGYRLEEHTPITPLSDVNMSNFPNILSNIHTLQGPLLDPVINFGKVTVSTGYDAVATSIILNTNEGSKLPDPSSGAFNLVWWNSTDYPDPSDDPNKEIVRCTAKTTDTLTVTRAQEGTTATAKNTVGKTYKMILTPTAKMMSDISSAITARVVKSGDTMTGTLNLPSNGLIVWTNQLIMSGGNVGIGTASPTRLLTVQSATSNWFRLGAGSNNSNEFFSVFGGNPGAVSGHSYNDSPAITVPKFLRFFTNASDESGTGATLTMLLDNNGNVGIGTTTPRKILHIKGFFEHALIQSTGGGGGTLFTSTDTLPVENALIGYSGLAIIPDRWGNVTTVDAHTSLLLAGSQRNINAIATGIGFANWGYFIGTGTGTGDLGNTTATSDAVKFKIYLKDTGSEFSQRLEFNSQSASATETNVMTMLSSGNVGIGTTNPTKRLEISDSNTEIARFTSSAAAAGIGLKDTASGGLQWNLFSTATAAGEGAGKLAFNLNDVGTMMVIDSSGNVGIGTTAPDRKLHIDIGSTVSGDVIYLTGDSSNAAYRIGLDGTGAESALYFSSINGSEKMRITNVGNVGIGTTNPLAKLDVSGTDAIKVPNGTTAQRPASPVAGMIRFNTTTLNFEGYTGSDWRPIVSLFAISASDNIIHAHDAAASTTSVNVIVKMKTITMGYSASGSVRIKFSLWSSSPSNTGAAGRIYKNGLPIGTLRYAQTILTFSEDFNMTWLSGDTIELWGNPYTNALAIYVSDFRICAVASGGTATNS